MTVPEPVGSAADSGVPGKFEVSGQRTTPGKTGLAYSHLVGEPVHITPTGKTPENRVSGTITGILIAVDPITYRYSQRVTYIYQPKVVRKLNFVDSNS